MFPHAFGDDMDVPFISWRLFKLQFGTGAMAPPANSEGTRSTHNHGPSNASCNERRA